MRSLKNAIKELWLHFGYMYIRIIRTIGISSLVYTLQAQNSQLK